MVPILNVLGIITLVVGVFLWIGMLQSGLSRMRGEEENPPDQPPDRTEQ